MFRLKTLRNNRKITMKNLGEVIGVGESTISLYESGKRQPDYETLKKIAVFFDVSIDYLLENDTIKKDPPSKDGEPLAVLQDTIDYEILGAFKKLSPQGQEAALAQLHILAKLEENREK